MFRCFFLAFLFILGQALLAHLVPCWWLWPASCISQDTYLLYILLYVSAFKYFSDAHGLKNKQNVGPSFTQRYLIQKYLFPIFNIHQLRVVLSPEVDKSGFNNVPANYILLQVRAELGWSNFKTWNFDFWNDQYRNLLFEIFSWLSIGDWVIHI